MSDGWLMFPLTANRAGCSPTPMRDLATRICPPDQRAAWRRARQFLVGVWAALWTFATVAAPEPAPRYQIINSTIHITNPPPGFESPDEAGPYINAVHKTWPWSSHDRPLVIYCDANAGSFSDADFREETPLSHIGETPGTVFFTREMGYCSRYMNEYSAICLEMGCRTDATVYSYQMLAQCPVGTYFRTHPNRCECEWGKGWSPERAKCVPVVEIDGLQAQDPCASPGLGNPVRPVTSTKVQRVGLGVHAGGEELSIVYDSRFIYPSASPWAKPITPFDRFPGFGPMWSGNMHRWLMYADGGREAAVMAVRGGGTIKPFKGGSGYEPMVRGEADRLLTEGYYRVSKPASIEHYDKFRVRSIQLGGAKYQFAYAVDEHSVTPDTSGEGRYLLSVSDAFGRTVEFRYERPAGSAQGRVSRIIDHAGTEIGFAYSAAGMLEEIRWQDGTSRRFLYEHNQLPQALTGVIDEAGVRHATFTYDDAGRAVATELAGAVGRYEILPGAHGHLVVADEFVAHPQAQVFDHVRRTRMLEDGGPIRVVVPRGSEISMTATQVDGSRFLTSQTQPAGSGCAASSRATSYDAHGHVARMDDFNGHRTCIANDLGRNLEVTRVEGLSSAHACEAVTPVGAALPAGARKFSTAWHPDWALKAKAAEPGRITTWIYNGQSDPFNAGAPAACAPAGAKQIDGTPIVVLCKTVEQATTDLDGRHGFSAPLQPGVPAREQRWTYNASGQMLTWDGPRTDLVDVTTYLYYDNTAFEGTGPGAVGHTKGDLQQVTNGAGQITRYTRYNRHGQVVEEVDANDVVTTRTYDLRQRLTSVTVAGRTTTYAYWPTGLLRQVTQPDNVTFLRYDYDGAHRLRAVVDNLGNRIDYTLDAAGNRTAEQVRDPGGALRRQVERQIDAIGRVQQTTGREH